MTYEELERIVHEIVVQLPPHVMCFKLRVNDGKRYSALEVDVYEDSTGRDYKIYWPGRDEIWVEEITHVEDRFIPLTLVLPERGTHA